MGTSHNLRGRLNPYADSSVKSHTGPVDNSLRPAATTPLDNRGVPICVPKQGRVALPRPGSWLP